VELPPNPTAQPHLPILEHPHNPRLHLQHSPASRQIGHHPIPPNLPSLLQARGHPLLLPRRRRPRLRLQLRRNRTIIVFPQPRDLARADPWQCAGVLGAARDRWSEVEAEDFEEFGVDGDGIPGAFWEVEEDV
jgi:hypothetical protein